MGQVIAISNQKGGVGKTTTCVNLATSLSILNKKVLVIDFDPQANATSGFGLDKEQPENNIYFALVNRIPLANIVQQTEIPGLFIITSSVNLSGAEVELANWEKREYVLKQMIDNVKSKYDYIFIDCPPSLGMLTLNSLTAADSVLVPLQCEYYALEGISQLLVTINLIRESYNPKLHIKGIVHTMYDPRNNISKQVVDEVKNHLNEQIFETIIPRNVRLSEAPSFGKPIFLYDRLSKGSVSYLQLAKELLKLDSP